MNENENDPRGLKWQRNIKEKHGIETRYHHVDGEMPHPYYDRLEVNNAIFKLEQELAACVKKLNDNAAHCEKKLDERDKELAMLKKQYHVDIKEMVKIQHELSSHDGTDSDPFRWSEVFDNACGEILRLRRELAALKLKYVDYCSECDFECARGDKESMDRHWRLKHDLHPREKIIP